MRLKYFITAFLLIFSSISYSEVIKKIDIIGLNSVDRGTVLSYLPYEVSDNFDINNPELILKSLSKTNFFKSVSLEFKDGDLIISVIENPTIKFVEFLGYKDDAVLNDDLIQKIKKNNSINVGKIFDQKNLNKLVGQLKNFYEAKGYYKVNISYKLLIDESNRIGIELYFEENDPALITKFEILGSEAVDKDDLKNLFEIGTPDFFILNYFTEKDKFKKSSLDAGVNSIRSKYLDLGYLDMKFDEINVSLNEQKTGIEIILKISEGDQYFIENFTFSGDIDEFNENILRSSVNLKSGDVFSRKEIVASASKLQSLYANIGYALTLVDTTFKTGNSKNKFIINFSVNKKKKMFVNRIDISGNTTTQDDVIRRELKLLEGQEFSQIDLDESIKKIKRLGYFSDINVKTFPVNGSDDKFNISISVTETKTGEFSIGLSHSNASGAAFNTGIQQNNILGTGNVLNAKFTSSKAVEELSLYFKNPYFNKSGHSISYGVFTKSTDAVNLDISDYILDENGAIFGYGVPLSEFSDVFAEIKLSANSITCSAKFASADYEQSQCANTKNNDFSISSNYEWNSLNDFYNPTDGMKRSFKTFLSLPIGDLKYYQFEAKQINYTPILDNSSFNTKFNFQFAQGYGGNELPFFKRYFGGGSSSVRGFDFNSLGSKYPDLKAKGGEVSFLSSAALISPASNFGINNPNIRLSTFIDAGSIYEKASNFDISDIRVSSGLAASWLTPIGPIGFYFAQPLIKKSSDSTENFAFELGTTF